VTAKASRPAAAPRRRAISDRELTRIVERAEARAWRDAVRAAPPAISRRLGLGIEPFAGGVALVASQVASGLYNRAFGFGLDAPVTEAALDRAIALYRRDRPFAIQPSPAVRPRGVRRWLEARGLHVLHHWVRWVRGARRAPEPPTELAIERIGSDRARRFVDLAFQIFDEPAQLAPWLMHSVGRRGWTHYLTFDGRRTVGVGTLYVEDGVGWLGWGGTLPSHRGRGGQSALLARRINDAIAQGCRWLTVETAEDLPRKPSPSYRNVRRAGFRVLFLRPSHVHFPPREGVEAAKRER
jgi:GNAT superfamily N-acetyltransferase